MPLQAEDGKDRHNAWLMLTTAAMWEQRGGRVEVRHDATGRLVDKWDHPQQGDDGPAWSMAGRALTEIKFTLEISRFCKLTERCTTSCGSTKCASVHIPSNEDKRGSTPAHLFGSCVVDQRISMSVNSTTVLWRTQNDCAIRCGIAFFVLWVTRLRFTHTHTSSATTLLVKTAGLYQDKMPLLLTLVFRFDVCHQLAVVLRSQPSPQNPRCTQVEKGEVEGRIPAAGLAAEILGVGL